MSNPSFRDGAQAFMRWRRKERQRAARAARFGWSEGMRPDSAQAVENDLLLNSAFASRNRNTALGRIWHR